MLLLPYFFYALWCVFFAFLNRIEIVTLNEKVLHWFNGLLHITVALFFGYAVHWWMGVSMLLIARLFFDVSLNLMRGLPFDYVPPSPASIVDRVEKWAFRGNGWVPKIVYALLLIFINFYYG